MSNLSDWTFGQFSKCIGHMKIEFAIKVAFKNIVVSLFDVKVGC